MHDQYLLFSLADEQYAINVHNVQEVLEYTKITTIPCALPFVDGLINSRGQGISVLNLRKKFGLPEIPIDRDTRIIVIELPQQSAENTILGGITDSVREVIDINENDIENAPKFGCKIPAKYIKGIVPYNDSFVTLLDATLVFNESDAISNSMATTLLESADEEDAVTLEEI